MVNTFILLVVGGSRPDADSAWVGRVVRFLYLSFLDSVGGWPSAIVKRVKIYTDGSSRGNPGPGGFGTVLIFGGHEKHLSRGFERTTNNRMEIMAALEGLRALKEPCAVTIYSDSQYLVNAMTKGWLEGWKRNGWAKKNRKEELKNVDLWKELDAAVRDHKVEWVWVRGHAGDHYNEVCDRLATDAADGEGRQIDPGFAG